MLYVDGRLQYKSSGCSHSRDLGLVSLSSSIRSCCLDNLRPGGAIRGISGTLKREGRGECCGYSEVFYVVAPGCVG
jgi:hypothetical protein